MDSLDAQCLVFELVGREIPCPDVWDHRRTGELSCAYARSERTFTWDADAVADMARRWRDSGATDAPEPVRPYLDAHRRLQDLLADHELGPPDAVVHDLGRREIRVRWEDEKVVMVIDEIPEG